MMNKNISILDNSGLVEIRPQLGGEIEELGNRLD